MKYYRCPTSRGINISGSRAIRYLPGNPSLTPALLPRAWERGFNGARQGQPALAFRARLIRDLTGLYQNLSRHRFWIKCDPYLARLLVKTCQVFWLMREDAPKTVTPTPTSTTGRIEGRVMVFWSGPTGEVSPIKGAYVELIPYNTRTKTDEQGYYSFSKLDSGIYQLVFGFKFDPVGARGATKLPKSR